MGQDLRESVALPQDSLCPRRCRPKIDGVTGRQPTVVAGVAVPQKDEVGTGVRLSLLQHH